MNKEETLALYAQGRDVWNAWAKEMLARRAELETKGEWASGRDSLGGERPENDSTKAWMAAAAARFDAHVFVEEADFAGFSFPSRAAFETVTFRKDAWFNNATFNGAAVFEDATFEQQARFGCVKFIKDGRFECATFSQSAVFYNVSFNDYAVFKSTTFSPSYSRRLVERIGGCSLSS